ncbi:MAG: nucleotide exchange factor GrpE [Candidatus Syntrophonatronum acetioxidans]|uniref:Protein GrpE n=1 Tax=Candidatus Syntrophonatronum acetioxidans TaxID=1795816 RepID=A0A424YJ80_9FIRM|nr:MAG: nucleotide exchange factor GrpE [Candidatus Syntrophonatronum acetioxidans]
MVRGDDDNKDMEREDLDLGEEPEKEEYGEGEEGEEEKNFRQNDLEKRGFDDSSEEIINFEEKLSRELESLQKEKEELFAQLQRLQADFDNYRKRARVEREQVADNALAEFMKSLLPVLDNFERALDSAGEDEGFASGVRMIFKQLKETLEKEGLEAVEAEGQFFDPYVHEAVVQVESSEHEENIVVEELQKGYKFKGKLVRPSMVKVAK